MSRPSGRLLFRGLRRFYHRRRGRRLAAGLLAWLCVWMVWRVALVLDPPPDPNRVRPAGVRILDAQGNLLRGYLSPDQKRRWRLSRQEISPWLVTAILEHEDRRFYQHPGVDPVAIVRAGWTNLQAGRITSGASTLSMQLARLVEPGQRSYSFKIKQAWRALQYEALYDKDEILAFYLNLAPFGGNIEGVGAAAQVYFGKPAAELSVGEACLLAVLPQAPGRRHPVRQPGSATRARDQLIAKLHQRGFLDDTSVAEALASVLPTRVHTLPFKAPHFCDWSRRRHPGQTTLTTTLDPDLQHRAETLVRNHTLRLRPLGIEQSAAVILNAQSGDLLAMVGSADFHDFEFSGQVNGAVALRSPGSTLKPFVYALAFDRGLATPAGLIEDVPIWYGDYAPRNYDGRYRGLVSAGEALRTSLNVPAVDLAAALMHSPNGGLHTFLKNAGMTSLDQPAGHYGLSLVLGGGDVTLLELASAYTVLCRQGMYQPLRELKALHDKPLPRSDRRLLSAPACWLTLREMTGVKRPQSEAVWRQTVRRMPIAWKTGTSYGHRDAWSVGVVGPYVVAVWVGNFPGQGSPHLSGSQVAAPLFFDLADALPDGPDFAWTRPPQGVATRQVCALSGAPAGAFCSQTRPAHFLPGLSPAVPCDLHRSVQIDTQTGHCVCSRCRTSGQWSERVVRWYSPHVATYLAASGLSPDPLPPHHPDCPIYGASLAPTILSPQRNGEYHLRNGIPPADQAIALKASASAAAGRLYWFVDGGLFTVAAPGQTAFLNAPPGQHRISVADESGRSAVVDITVLAAP